MGNAFAPDDDLRRKWAGKGAWRRYRGNDSLVFAEFADYFTRTIPSWFKEMRVVGKAPPHPSINQPMGEINASQAKPARARCKGNELEARITDRR